ncbi:MAG: DNA mismatch repair protein MutS, partial [Planctomycetia bacterium]
MDATGRGGANTTPMMRQYLEAKRQAPEALLLFRMGDFYELFFEDAREAARLLGISVTSRDRDKGDDAVPMSGFPYHALEGYLRKLIAAGKKVAVCEQTEEPSQAKGLVRREITRVVTPGTLTDESLLDPRKTNYLAAVAPAKGKAPAGLAWLDLSIGRLIVAAIPDTALGEEFSRLEPSELLVPEGFEPPAVWFPVGRRPALSPRPPFTFQRDNAVDLLQRHFAATTFGGYGVDDDSPGLAAAGALLAYLLETQRSQVDHVRRLAPFLRRDVMLIDPMSRRNLELTRGMRDGGREFTLLDAVDETVTAGGARRLADWISQPLLQVVEIQRRQAAVAEWKDAPGARRELRALLEKTFDVERLTARVNTHRTHPRDLSTLRATLAVLPAVKAKLAGRNALLTAELETAIELLPELRSKLEAAIV